jgi:hypothetical protein
LGGIAGETATASGVASVGGGIVLAIALADYQPSARRQWFVPHAFTIKLK